MVKTTYSFLTLAALCAAGAALTSCDDSDAVRDEGKTPRIDFVRITDPEAADSLITAAAMGQQIVLMGEHLGDVREIYFNDIKALLNPTLITSYSIIVDVPSQIPGDVTNLITLVTSQGNRATHDFSVTVPAPSVTDISCEYAKPGETITLTGNYFIDPVVYFPGVAEAATVVSSDMTSIRVEVPQGVEEGPVVVESIYGRGRTKFNFMDTNGLLTNFDDGYEQPWGRGTIASEGGISGNYLLFESPMMSAWGWSDSLMWGYWAYAPGAHGNSPIAQGELNSLALKFEANIETWIDCPMLIWFQPWNPNGNISPDDPLAQCHWKPYIKNGIKQDAATGGWVTVTIPLTEFRYDKEESVNNLSLGDIANYTDLNIMFFGACDDPGPMKVMLDNFRIVNIR
ncbi:MAG: IPT/TIG domain-containing protein [Muribaculaceae bacterium]|nr:IPT/TIG domain-containing protein [Muribaculaceae bacterium]